MIKSSISTQGVAYLALNSPEKRNAFNDQMIQQLNDALIELDQHPDVRALVLSGEGQSFSAGADLGWMKSMAQFDEQTNYEDAMCLARLLHQLYTFSKPTIARVHGACFGGALGLIAACDIAVASKDATFSFTEVKLGLVPAVISPYVVQAIGPRQTRRLFLTAEQFDSKQAQEFGLITHCVDGIELEKIVDKQLQFILKGGPIAQLEAKKLVHSYAEISDDVLEETSKLIARLRVSAEGQEGLGAFFDKRSAKWIK